jgi:hypothetical protein
VKNDCRNGSGKFIAFAYENIREKRESRAQKKKKKRRETSDLRKKICLLKDFSVWAAREKKWRSKAGSRERGEKRNKARRGSRWSSDKSYLGEPWDALLS